MTYRIPYVIDNIDVTLADVLNTLLDREPHQQFDVATAYFSIHGYDQIRSVLPAVRHFRLLLGESIQDSGALGIRPEHYLRQELNAAPLSPGHVEIVEALIRFLARDDVQVRLYLGHDPQDTGRRRFLHAKCYLFYGGRNNMPSLFDGMFPLVGIVGSSNFTRPGLTTNRELNLVHKTLLDEDEIEDTVARREVEYHADTNVNTRISPDNQRLLKSEVGARAIMDLKKWYEEQWNQSTDIKADLIDILENSKFGGREYTPYEIYMKALYTYFEDDLDTDLSQPATRSAVELAEFQEDAVKKARRILARYDGVMIADSVGLGKTWIGKKLLEDYAYHQRMKALVICPAALRMMWESELKAAAISAYIVSQEALGQEDYDYRQLTDVDVILIDEAHNFRNRLANRYANMEQILAANGRRGRSGMRKKVILLTATPINNNIFDLYNQINLFTGNDRTYFAPAGIGDLYRYFLAARRESIDEGSIRIFNLLEEVVVRRTRQFIRRAYPEATIRGKIISWPERQLRTVRYDLEATYEGFYADIVKRIETLKLAHYNLEAYKRSDQTIDDFELGRQGALVGIFKSRFLKRLESSIESFRISIQRALEFAKTFTEYVQEDIILDSASFHSVMRMIESDDDNGNGTPKSRARHIDRVESAREIIEELPRLDPEKYDKRRLYAALQDDIDRLTDIWHEIKSISDLRDAKLERFKELLATQLRGQKVLIFSYYKDTAQYVYQSLLNDSEWQREAGAPYVRRIDSDVKTADRSRIVEAFAPVAHDVEVERQIDVLIATDVLSEGQNLQDCGYLINYDLHWNPTRMVQRAGRIDRLGSPYKTLYIYNMFPEHELEILLGLVSRLTEKIEVINQTGFLDASVLGEVVTPRDFNTLRRIADEDNSVIEEQESFLELASSEALMAQLQKVLATEARRWITDLDDGIHSGLERQQMQGVFFYFTAPHPEGGKNHFWRYYDLNRRTIIDNRYQIMQLITCGPETPRFPPPYHEVDIFEVQDKVIDSILGDVHEQQAAQLVDKPVAEEQNVARDILRQFVSHPDFDRNEIKALRKFLKEPLVGSSVRQLREALTSYNTGGNSTDFVDVIRGLFEQQGSVEDQPTEAISTLRIKREDLHLVCYEYVCS